MIPILFERVGSGLLPATPMAQGHARFVVIAQESLGRDPFAGDVFVFRGRSGSLIKAWRGTMELIVALRQAVDRWAVLFRL